MKSESYSDKGGWGCRDVSESPIWCVDFCNDLIVLGCADGRLEFWEATSGKLMVSFSCNYTSFSEEHCVCLTNDL